MNDFVRCNKLSGIYWLKEPVDKINIKIKLKPPDDILSLPKFEDFTNESNGINLETITEEYTFKWQEKVFSAWEIQRYNDVHNCITETELEYHEVLKSNSMTPSKVFSYIHDDYYKPLPLDGNIKKLTSKMECLNLNAAVGKIEQSFSGKSNSMRHLFKSEENVQIDEKWCAMHVVLDNSDYNEESQLLLKKDTTLLSLFYNITYNYIILTPDVNNMELNPYTVDDAAVPLGHKYEVDVDFGETESCDDLVVLLRKLHKRWEKKHKNLTNFTAPPIGRVWYNVCIDIVSATGFDQDNLYIEYHIKLPEGVETDNVLTGRTHTSKYTRDDEEIWHFGHLIDLTMEANVGFEPSPLQLYLEVISTDWFNRARTEGYTHKPLTLLPGSTSRRLRCSRPEEGYGGEERRFFIGGCHLIGDLDVFSGDEMQNTNATFTTTGTISVRYNVIRQTSAPGTVHTSTTPTTASALLMGAETALRKYKKARARLAAATKDLNEINVDRGDGLYVQEESD